MAHDHFEAPVQTNDRGAVGGGSEDERVADLTEGNGATITTDRTITPQTINNRWGRKAGEQVQRPQLLIMCWVQRR